jgi:hypothetical protein
VYRPDHARATDQGGLVHDDHPRRRGKLDHRGVGAGRAQPPGRRRRGDDLGDVLRQVADPRVNQGVEPRRYRQRTACLRADLQPVQGAATSKHVSDNYDTCTYKNTGTHASPVDIQDLTVTVISGSGCYSDFEQADGPGVKVSGVGDQAFGYQIGIIVKAGNRCLDVSGLTFAELQNHYGPDTAMAKIIIAKLS